MEQEKIETGLPEVQENELKEERLKKIFIIFAVLLLFGGTYYYYAGMNVGPSRINVEANRAELASGTKILKQIQDGKAAPYRKRRLEQLEKIQKAEKNPEIKLEETAITEKYTRAKIRPTGKSVLLSLAGKSSGKHDPFSYSESRYVPFSSGVQSSNSFSPPGNLPPVPGAMGNLPSMPNLPGSSLSGPNIPGLPSSGLANPPAPKPEDMVVIKGFIGNKVIAEIEGVVEALNTNESVNNVKVLTVNPGLLSAKFEINGKTVTKTMKSINNENIELVKNSHN